ncbi:MAG: hypothetical protein R2838_17775 [Caldilineaceae bacterium]
MQNALFNSTGPSCANRIWGRRPTASLTIWGRHEVFHLILNAYWEAQTFELLPVAQPHPRRLAPHHRHGAAVARRLLQLRRCA